jgi:hypothetical protein
VEAAPESKPESSFHTADRRAETTDLQESVAVAEHKLNTKVMELTEEKQQGDRQVRKVASSLNAQIKKLHGQIETSAGGSDESQSRFEKQRGAIDRLALPEILRGTR